MESTKKLVQTLEPWEFPAECRETQIRLCSSLSIQDIQRIENTHQEATDQHSICWLQEPGQMQLKILAGRKKLAIQEDVEEQDSPFEYRRSWQWPKLKDWQLIDSAW